MQGQQMHVLIADDHALVRQSLAMLLRAEPGIEVVREASDGATAVQMMEQLTPEIVLLDIKMPDMSGSEATRQIMQAHPDVRVIALSMHTERFWVNRMLEAGVCGYVLKGNIEEVMQALRTCTDGKIYLSPGLDK